MARDAAYRKAEEKIEQARRSGATELYLGYESLSDLPKALGQLTQLRWLYLQNNRLMSLPEWLGQLMQLEGLVLSRNQLTSLPESLGQLTQLRELYIPENQLMALPKSLDQLTQLRVLYLSGNGLTSLPESLSQLAQLRELYISENHLTALSTSLGQLTQLEKLDLSGNRLTSLPESLGRLAQLEMLVLSGNPLNPDLAAAYRGGFAAVRRYLKELAKGVRKRFEAKLLILGDGNEGKTCVSRALRDLPFQPQATTRGVDVVQWRFDHPDAPGDREKRIALNIWDFEGQEINHQTHQFFLTAQALYVLVFKCRDQFLMDRAEYWLDTIRSRAPKARVAIAISQCEQRTPYVPRDKIEAQYGDLLAEGQWLFAVGCENNSGIPELQRFLKRWAADLEFMGSDWPATYEKAEAAIGDWAKNGAPHIGRGELYGVFERAGIDAGAFDDAAAALARLGAITQFPDCPALRDFVVLQPQWLTKAISEIMEDKQLDADQGEISLQRMRGVWDEKGYGGLFPTFHDCMKEFELCYDLEDAGRGCLVPLRFGYARPRIPWSGDPDMKERRVEYKLNIRPPMGLMSRFIVKTHHMMVKTEERPKGVYWHNGVFLRTGTGPLASEALCEFDAEARRLRVQVRAAFPQNLIEQIHAYVKAVFSFFSGLEAERSYGCMKIDDGTDAEEGCKGMHTESRIYSAIRKQRVLDCEHEFHDVDPQKLIWGFSSFGEYVLAKVASIDELRRELDQKPEWAGALTRDIGTLLDWVEDNGPKVDRLLLDQANLLPEMRQEAELKLHEYLGYMSEMLDERDRTSAPALFSVNTKDGSAWDPRSYFAKTYVLTPFCECRGNIHPCADGRVEFVKDREWWSKTAPWIARATKVLSAGLRLACAGMPLALGNRAFEPIENDVKFMKELAKHIVLTPPARDDRGARGLDDMLEGRVAPDLRQGDPEARLMRAALSRFLEAVAPDNYRARQWGSLRRVRMADNSYRWLCESCAQRTRI